MPPRSGLRDTPLVARTETFVPQPLLGRGPITSHGDPRAHGDPFPLPDTFTADSTLSTSLRERLSVSVASLNRLAASGNNSGSVEDESRPPFARTGKPSCVQIRMLAGLRRRIEAYGLCPDNLSEESSLRVLLSKADRYSLEPKHLVDVDLSRLKILTRDISSQPIESFLPAAAAKYISFADQLIVRSEASLEADRQHGFTATPYWDPGLRKDKSKLFTLLAGLAKRGLVGVRQRVHSWVGLFAVKKKDSWQRLIIDARAANAFHHAPPVTRLGSLGSMVDIDLSPGSLRASGFGSFPELGGNEGDVGDCYYNFRIDKLASWFGVNLELSGSEVIAEFGITSDYDDEAQRYMPIDPGKRYYPVFCGMGMGWAWGLYFANEAVTHMVSTARDGIVEDALRERSVVPVVKPGQPIVGTYVDNVQVLGAVNDVNERMQGIVNEAGRLKIPFDLTYAQASLMVQVLGVVYDFASGKLRHSSARVWSLYLATRAMLRRRALSAKVLEIWLGHSVHILQLIRPAYSCFSFVYRFIDTYPSGRHTVWPSVRMEMRNALGLYFWQKPI